MNQYINQSYLLTVVPTLNWDNVKQLCSEIEAN